MPVLTESQTGCNFLSRCPVALEVCDQHPELSLINDSRGTRCHRWQELHGDELTIEWQEDRVEDVIEHKSETKPTLVVEDVSVSFPLSPAFTLPVLGSSAARLQAVNKVSLELAHGQTLGLVGESGSGKTTFARAIVGLLGWESGEVQLLGKHLPEKVSQRDIETIRQIQMVFQNPNESLNPNLTIGETLRRPLMRLEGLGGQEASAMAVDLLDSVQLPREYASRFPGQLSGGEKQRVAIARAFATRPPLLIADEPVSSLDVSVQAAILNLLHNLQIQSGGAHLFISHDLAVVGYFADVIAVMYLGRLMEVGEAEEMFVPPHHPYTEALISAIPRVGKPKEGRPILLEGDIPGVEEVPTGCPFHTRCPRHLGDICRDVEPTWRVTCSGKHYFCHMDEAQLNLVPSSVEVADPSEGS